MKVLELLCDTAMTQVDFWGAVLSAGYGASSSKIEYEYQKRRKANDKKQFQVQDLKERRKRLLVYISKMKHDGLIKELTDNKFTISAKGIKKLAQLKIKNSLPNRHYPITDKGNSIIISFDVPEKFRRKRDWLREVIRNLGFTMVHQSVWIGNIKIPKTFLIDLEKLKILECVEIFEISKTGTLKKIDKS